MTIGVVLVHYCFWPDVRQTLDALAAQTRPPDRVLVLDDCSPDGSVERIAEAYPHLEVEVAPHNRGCVANFNAGLRRMLDRGMDAVLLLTHETALERSALEELAGRLERAPHVGAVGPLLGFLSRPDVVFSAGGMLQPGSWQNPHAGMYEPIERWRGAPPREVPWLDTACVLVRAQAIEQTGLLSERYFHYYDDVELGVRLNQAGWAVECIYAAVGRQQPGKLSEYYRVRNRLGFIAATGPRRVLARAIATHVHRIAADVARGREGRPLAVAQARALRDFALGRWGEADPHVAAASRRDYATGGALDGAPEPSWAPDQTRGDDLVPLASAVRPAGAAGGFHVPSRA
jgi:N-acetylglucosaminyl-diphospho-decaprenol L-rhamnosyltransferase